MKVTDIDTSNEADPDDASAATCDPDDHGVSWPYSASDLAYVYDTYGGDDYAGGVWSLNAAEETVDAMLATGQHINFVDVNGGQRWIPAAGTTGAAYTECNWYSFAALNDVMQDNWDASSDHDLHSGAVLGVGSGTATAQHWACTYWHFVERARQEADDHDDVVKAVLIDELNHVVDGPDTWLHDRWNAANTTTSDYATEPWSFQNSHWDRDNVEWLADMVDGSYGGPDDDKWGRSESDTGICPSADTLDGADIELWARVNDVAAARHIVPAAILGVPADPDYLYDPSGGGSPTGDYEFLASNGDGMSVSFDLLAPSFTVDPFVANPVWTVNVELLYTKAWSSDTAKQQDIELTVELNGTALHTSPIDLDPVDMESIRRFSHCAGGSVYCATSAWYTTGTNTIELSIAPTGDTDLDQDRTVYLWALRVQYINAVSGVVFYSSSLDGGLPTDSNQGSYTISGSPGAAALAELNDDWRFEDLLDGVVFSHDVTAPYYETAWARFVEHACDHLHNDADDDRAIRCMVDERAQIFDSDYYSAFDLPDTESRLEIGRDHADGVLALYLPMALRNMASDQGRFTDRDPMDSGYEVMVYEPRLTRTILGETHEYMAQVPAGCSGDYDVDVWVDKENDDPEFTWYVDYDDGSTSLVVISHPVEDAGTGGDDYEAEIQDVSPGDYIYAGWYSRGGAAALNDANFVEFAFDHSDPSCALTWTRINDIDPNYTDTEDIYDCIVDAFTGPTTFSCPP